MSYNKETKYRYSILIDSLGAHCPIVEQALKGLSAALTGENCKVEAMVVSNEELSKENKLEKAMNILSEFEKIRGFELSAFYRTTDVIKNHVLDKEKDMLNPRDLLVLENSFIMQFQKNDEIVYFVVDINGPICLIKKEDIDG